MSRENDCLLSRRRNTPLDINHGCAAALESLHQVVGWCILVCPEASTRGKTLRFPLVVPVSALDYNWTEILRAAAAAETHRFVDWQNPLSMVRWPRSAGEPSAADVLTITCWPSGSHPGFERDIPKENNIWWFCPQALRYPRSFLSLCQRSKQKMDQLTCLQKNGWNNDFPIAHLHPSP